MNTGLIAAFRYSLPVLKSMHVTYTIDFSIVVNRSLYIIGCPRIKEKVPGFKAMAHKKT